MKKYNIETIAVQGGYKPGNSQPRQLPIYQSTTFKYDTSADMAKLFDLESNDYMYSRLANPTCDAVAAKIAALEGGASAMLTSSGQAANFYSVFNIAGCGDHIVSSISIYGGTFNLFSVTMKKMGIEFTFVDPDLPWTNNLSSSGEARSSLTAGKILPANSPDKISTERYCEPYHNNPCLIKAELSVCTTFAASV